MKMHVLSLVGALALLAFLGTPAQAQQTKKKTTYNRARSGAYARYDRSGRRDEENLKLAPGMRLNMPSPPTTDYMGRPLKKKPARPSTSTTTLSAGTTPATPVKAAAPAKKRR
ncbi:hypothetical protein HMJ29_05675 [Hymenobacter taeanensis]|uniref:Uncharacterized protein n=1 Tax=Hymenobacter taeanensis TaxID=2735321 RepID=A0A6M6BET3_9BACT|nr:MULTISPECIES: hypothetical protein [Hymenobacter]QJX46452.1 hypothetical protein HMJ29_05675 [Hymenobacter taeanensis]UOQ80315.1 hypothetical protein MUN83_15990 [Hymenobacter sp. 5414T-23]